MRGIFITDLDGTLLQSNQRISDYCIEVLNKAIEAGHLLSFATARGMRSSMQTVGAVKWNEPVILYNGALVYDARNGQVIDGNWLDNQLTNELILLGKQSGLTPFHFMLDEGSQERVLHERLTTFGMTEFLKSRPNDPRFREIEKLHATAEHRTLVLTYISELENLLPLKEKIEAEFASQVSIHMMKDYYIANQYFLEFSHPVATKREGLNMWAKHMKIDAASIHVFGDNLNDLGLFAAGGRRLAVANAHQQILQLADEVIASNNDDGVARYIDHYMKQLVK